MATVSYIKHKHHNAGALKGVLAYVVQEDKTGFENRLLVSGIGCDAGDVFIDMMEIKSRFGKLDGRFFYHICQSFHPDENILPDQAHALALKLGEYFKDHQVLVATHTDADHIHSHLIINSANQETGRKWHTDKHELERLRKLSDELCRQQTLSILPPYVGDKSTLQLGSREFRSAKKGESWKFTLIRAIDDALARSSTKEDFLQNMNYEGYQVTWTSDRKYISYIMPDGKRCRDIKLHDEIYLKDNMERLFEYRLENGFEPLSPEPADGWLSEVHSHGLNDSEGNEEFAAVAGGDGVLHGLLRVGKDLSNIPIENRSAKPAGHNDHKSLQREKIKKLAAGHKLRDELEEEQKWR